MKKDSLIITRETMLGHLLFILEKLNNIDNLLSVKIKNKAKMAGGYKWEYAKK